MSEKNKVRKFLSGLGPGEIEEMNKVQIEETQKQFKEFLTAFKKDCCYLCGMKLSYFNEHESCFHWFLQPKGIKKKHFESYLKKPIGFFQLQSYLRWVANTDEKIKNINDLSNENLNGKLLETTIKFKNIEWSFNYGKTDLEGHKGTHNGDFPHFHMQILRDNLPIISFNNLHIPFSNHDVFMIEAMENDDLMEHIHLFGEGISVLENENELKWIDNEMVAAESKDSATFHSTSFFEMPDGQTISFEDLDKIRVEAITKRIPIRKLLAEKIPDIKIITEINAGKGVVKKKTRKKTRIKK
jgi:hypothetical protein